MSNISPAIVSNSLPLPPMTGSLQLSSRQPAGAATAKVAQDFESVFASMMIKQLRQSLEPDSLFGQDSGDIYGGLFDRYLGKHMSKGTGLGMSKMLLESMERMQRAASSTSRPESVAQEGNLPNTSPPRQSPVRLAPGPIAG